MSDPKDKEPSRTDELSKKEAVSEELLKVYNGIDKGFQDAADRINDTLDYWQIFNCEYGSKQYYNGNANVYVPIVHDAIEARKTRFVNQVFPTSGNYVECDTDQDDLPEAQIALINHYIEKAGLRTVVLPALFKNGDVEGQWNIYVDWFERTRYVTEKVKRGPDLGDGLVLAPEDVNEDEQVEDTDEKEVHEFGPLVEVIPDTDILIMPAIAESVDDALYRHGGSVTIMRRWSKEMIQAKMDADEITKDGGEELLERFKQGGATDNPRKDAMKEHVDSAGIKGGGKYALVYETWKMLKVEGKRRLTRTFFGGDNLILSCRLNPFWCDLCPLISAPVDKITGSAKGISKVKAVEKLQYLANDYMNQGADSASYGLNPIIATNPIDNPKVGSMVIDQGAVWEVNPETTRFMEFPKLWEDALTIVGALSQQIMQTLGVNPSMVPQRSGSKKPTQAEILAEQAVDMVTTADVIIPFEAGVLTPMLERFVAYDAQFRDEAIWVRAFGEAGLRSAMQEVPAQQQQNRVIYRWLGVEAARTAAQTQQQIGLMNVLRTIPPDQLGGRRIDMKPIVERAIESACGPKLAQLVFPPADGVKPEMENQILAQGVDIPVHLNDNDAEHMQAHMQLPPSEVRDGHMRKHQQQMSMKNQAAAQQQAAQQQGGGGGGPKPGGAPKGKRNVTAPPGALRPGQMAGGMPGMA